MIPEPEPAHPERLLRALKQMYPDLYRTVGYEIDAPHENGKPAFEVPEDFHQDDD